MCRCLLGKMKSLDTTITEVVMSDRKIMDFIQPVRQFRFFFRHLFGHLFLLLFGFDFDFCFRYRLCYFCLFFFD